MIVRPSRVVLPPGALRREPPRPAGLREPDYDDRFDASTLFYDVFRCHRRVVAVGPPLLNLAGHLRAPHLRDGVRTLALDRTQRTLLGDTGDTVSVALDGRWLSAEVGADLAALFRGRRALTTLSLDNDLAWIRDWVRWHVAVHGTDAVLFYDNGSRSYGLDELHATIAGVPGVRVAVVVDWRFRYGPQGTASGLWDSDFAQYGALEHARWRFLREAAGVLNADVDELVWSGSGESVYEVARRSPTGFVSFPGRWVHRPPGADGPVRHADCSWVDDAEAPTPTKWCAVPRRLPAAAQLQVHGATGVDVSATYGLGYWHFREVSTHWKEDRRERRTASATFHEVASARDQLDRVLGSGGGAAPAPGSGSGARRVDARPVLLARRVVADVRRARTGLAGAGRGVPLG